MNILQRKIKEKEKFLTSLKEETSHKRIKERILSPKLQKEIQDFQKIIQEEVCAEIPNAFWSIKKFKVELLYEEGFDEVQMNKRLLEICKKEIDDLLSKGLIRRSSSLWSCVGNTHY